MSYIFIILAAICNAFIDKVENENFYTSIFNKLNEKFWYKRESWKYAKKIFNYKVDAWHIAKSLMIIFVCLAIVFYKKSAFPVAIEIIAFGIYWNLTFNLFYNTIFKK